MKMQMEGISEPTKEESGVIYEEAELEELEEKALKEAEEARMEEEKEKEKVGERKEMEL